MDLLCCQAHTSYIQVKNMFCTKRLQYDIWEKGLNCDYDIFFTEVSNFDQCVSDF